MSLVLDSLMLQIPLVGRWWGNRKIECEDNLNSVIRYQDSMIDYLQAEILGLSSINRSLRADLDGMGKKAAELRAEIECIHAELPQNGGNDPWPD